MARGEVRVRIHEGPEWERVIASLREVDANLAKWLRRELRKSIKPAVDDAKNSIRTLPVRGRGHTGLRAKVARGIVVKSAARGDTAFARIQTTMPQGNEYIIPRGFASKKGWRHPVFGTDKWVQQPPLVRWDFYGAISGHRQEITKNLEHVLEEAAHRVAGH